MLVSFKFLISCIMMGPEADLEGAFSSSLLSDENSGLGDEGICVW